MGEVDVTLNLHYAWRQDFEYILIISLLVQMKPIANYNCDPVYPDKCYSN